MPFESVPSRNIPFYVSSPLVLIPRRPPNPLIPLLLPSVRSKGIRRPSNPLMPLILPTVRSKGIRERLIRNGMLQSTGHALAVSSLLIHMASYRQNRHWGWFCEKKTAKKCFVAMFICNIQQTQEKPGVAPQTLLLFIHPLGW